MLKQRTQYDDEFKKNAAKLNCAGPKPVRAVAEDPGMAVNLLYNRRKKYTAEGEKTPMATTEQEPKALRLENAELKYV